MQEGCNIKVIFPKPDNSNFVGALVNYIVDLCTKFLLDGNKDEFPHDELTLLPSFLSMSYKKLIHSVFDNVKSKVVVSSKSVDHITIAIDTFDDNYVLKTEYRTVRVARQLRGCNPIMAVFIVTSIFDIRFEYLEMFVQNSDRRAWIGMETFTKLEQAFIETTLETSPILVTL
jgi:hypothetical protein